MKIHFYHHNLTNSIDEFSFIPNDGLDHWITTTFLVLKQNFEEITIGPEIPLEGIIIFHKRYFSAKIKPTKNQFFVCLQVDSGRHPYAQCHIVHNPYQESFFHFPKLIIDFLFGFSKTKFVCSWPQHNMISREISRKNVFKTISFHGNILNIPKEVVSDDFNLFLKNHDLELKVKSEPNVWNDFSDSDLSICFRSFDNQKYYFKPYLKIMNSLLAGVPVVSGYDSSSVYFRDNYVTIPLVKNISELKELILQIAEKKYDPMKQLDEFKKHKNKFEQNEIQKDWILVFKQVEKDYNKWMSSSNFKRRLFMEVRSFYVFMLNSSKFCYSFLSQIKNKIKNLKRLDAKNVLKLLRYKLKKKINIKPSRKETDLYVYYSYLVKYNGFLVEETEKYYISNFKNKFSGLLKLRKRPSSDFDVFFQIFEFSEYLPVVNDYKRNFKNPPDYNLNIIDAGSNIGLTSLFCVQHFESAKIIAVEPDSDNFQNLSFNVNNLKEKEKFEFITINGGVWSSNSKIKVINDFRDKSDWAFRVEETDDFDALQAYSIDYLASKNNFEYIDILKMDIEGSEKQIFKVDSSDLEFLNITKCIAIEIHDEFDCREEIYSILENYGFLLRNEGELTIGINERLRNKFATINI